jgi:glutaredoxin
MDNGHKYLIYGRSSCPFCSEAVQILRSLKIESVFFDLEGDREFLDEAKAFYNRKTVPIVLKIDENTDIVRLIGGCDDLKGDLGD